MIQIITLFLAITGVFSICYHFTDIKLFLSCLWDGVKTAFDFEKQKYEVENCCYNNMPKDRNPPPPMPLKPPLRDPTTYA